MAIVSKTDYRLPGVYSKEVTGPKLNVTIGGPTTVAFVGPAVGHYSATDIGMCGKDGMELTNSGVMAGTLSVRNRVLGTMYAEGRDFRLSTAMNGACSVERIIHKCEAKAWQTVAKGCTFTWWAAEPNVDLTRFMSSSNLNGRDGYVVKGTLSLAYADGDKRALVEGESFVVDYHSGILSAKYSETAQIENGRSLTVSFKYTTAEPVELVGEASYQLTHTFPERFGLVEEKVDADGAVTTRGVTVRLYVCEDYTDVPGTTPYKGKFGTVPQPGAAEGYIDGVDFEVDTVNGRIKRLPGSRVPSFDGTNGAALMYAEFEYCAIQQGARLSVTYDYTGDGYGDARYYGSYSELIATCGAPWDADGNILSPLSVAAYIANQNGMGGCYAVPVVGVTVNGQTSYPLTSWQAAFDALTLVEGVDLVVPLSADTAVWSMAKAHMTRMIENQDERCTFLGMDGTDDASQAGPLSVSTMEGLAQTFAANDTLLAAPSTFRFRNPVTSVIEVMPGYYMAAALAGYECSIARYIPLTNKIIGGVYGANERHTKVQKTEMCANGLTYVDEATGAMRVLHGRSTSTDSVIDQEINITLSKYYIIKTMRRAFSNGFIGSVITPSTIATIGATAQNVLTSLQANGYMTSWSGLSVKQDTVNMTQVNVEFQYRPTYSLNYIEIEFAVDSTTGTTASYTA